SAAGRRATKCSRWRCSRCRATSARPGSRRGPSPRRRRPARDGQRFRPRDAALAVPMRMSVTHSSGCRQATSGPAVRGAVVYSPRYRIDIGPHVFPTEKYGRVFARLVDDRVIASADVVEPEAATWNQLSLVHTSDYLDRMRDGTMTDE